MVGYIDVPGNLIYFLFSFSIAGHLLPAPWQAVLDEGSGYYYYWNFETNEVQWVPPPAPKQPPKPKEPTLPPVPGNESPLSSDNENEKVDEKVSSSNNKQSDNSKSNKNQRAETVASKKTVVEEKVKKAVSRSHSPSPVPSGVEEENINTSEVKVNQTGQPTRSGMIDENSSGSKNLKSEGSNEGLVTGYGSDDSEEENNAKDKNSSSLVTPQVKKKKGKKEILEILSRLKSKENKEKQISDLYEDEKLSDVDKSFDTEGNKGKPESKDGLEDDKKFLEKEKEEDVVMKSEELKEVKSILKSADTSKIKSKEQIETNDTRVNQKEMKEAEKGARSEAKDTEETERKKSEEETQSTKTIEMKLMEPNGSGEISIESKPIKSILKSQGLNGSEETSKEQKPIKSILKPREVKSILKSKPSGEQQKEENQKKEPIKKAKKEFKLDIFAAYSDSESESEIEEDPNDEETVKEKLVDGHPDFVTVDSWEDKEKPSDKGAPSDNKKPKSDMELEKKKKEDKKELKKEVEDDDMDEFAAMLLEGEMFSNQPYFGWQY